LKGLKSINYDGIDFMLNYEYMGVDNFKSV
jgi:hypothetical protein